MAKLAYDTVVVGGGIAGLTAAAFLSKAGQKVLLVEKNKECGGLVNSFTRDGFHFDAGVRALEDAGIILPMLRALDIQLQVVKSPVSIGIEGEIITIDGVESLSRYRNLLVRLFPKSESEIDELIKVIRRIMKHMDVLYGIENPLFKDIKHDRNYLFKILLPWLPKFLLTIGKINRMRMPVEDYLQRIIRSPSLRDMISQHFFKNTPAFFALSYFSLYLDYFYPKGGTGKLSDAVEDKVKKYGGEIKRETIITAVSAEKRQVCDHTGVWYSYDNLIWAADLKTLYKILDSRNLIAEERFQKTKKTVLQSRGGDSVFSLFLEVDKPLSYFKNIANGHFFYTPCKKGLGETHRSELSALLSNIKKVTPEHVLEWLERFIRQNTFEISIPGLKDPEMVPPNQSGVIISVLAEYDLFAKIRDAGWLENFVHEMENKIIEVITGSVYPELKTSIIKQFSFSPLSIENRVGSSEGAIVGWEFREPMPVVNKMQISDRSIFTPVPSIYQAGQWAYSPTGVPMAILTGKLAADRILKTQKVSD